MSGHNKWSSIKHKKAAVDAKRGKIFTRYLREIAVSVRSGGEDPESNPRLRAAITAAKSVNMPKDNIERAISRASGSDEGANIEEVRYEGYGQGGIAILVDCMTDNRNRTVSDVRSAFNKGGGHMGESGCVSWMFHQKGQFVFAREAVDEVSVMEIAMNAGAEDIRDETDAIVITSEPANFNAIQSAFDVDGLTPLVAEISWIPENSVAIDGEPAEKLLALIERLEELDDVQNVYANFDISDDEMARIND